MTLLANGVWSGVSGEGEGWAGRGLGGRCESGEEFGRRRRRAEGRVAEWCVCPVVAVAAGVRSPAVDCRVATPGVGNTVPAIAWASSLLPQSVLMNGVAFSCTNTHSSTTIRTRRTRHYPRALPFAHDHPVIIVAHQR